MGADAFAIPADRRERQVARNRIKIDLLVAAAQEISRFLTNSNIPHGVLGGVAVHLHGAERADGDDIDVLVAESNEDTVPGLILKLGFQKKAKYFERANIKSQIKTQGRGFPSFPNPEDSNEWISVDGVRVPTIDKMIETKAEACRDILEKWLSKGIGGPSSRSSLIKHATDLVRLVKLYAKK